MIKLLIIIVLFWGCKHDITSKKNDNIKYFISLNSFNELQIKRNKELPIFSIPEICFDTLLEFKQIDSLKSKICRKHNFRFGIIPLKYTYKNAKFLLSAFPFSCSANFLIALFKK